MTGRELAVQAPTVGDMLPVFAVDQVSADHIDIVALLLRDSNPIHFDVDAVIAAGLGDRVVNQGGTTLAYIYDMLIAWQRCRGGVRRVDCRFRANVFAGDSVVAGGVVTAVRDVEAGHDVDCDVWVDTIGGTRAIAGTATVFFGTTSSGEADSA